VADPRVHSHPEAEPEVTLNWTAIVCAAVVVAIAFAAIAALLWRAVFHHF
jgi:hypothetical protein